MSKTFSDLLRPAQPTLDDDALVARMLDAAQWEGQLNATLDGDNVATAPFDPEALVDRVDRQGWARIDGALSAGRVQLLLDAIAQVGRQGLPPVFAYLYPEVWAALASPSLRGPLEALSPGARQLPRSWITVVRPHDGARGWAPHLDASRPATQMDDGRYERLTLWIALTDATVDNGCMYLVPVDRVRGPFTDLFTEARVSSARALALMHAVQAAPCTGGGALVWRTDVIHFGGWASGEGLTSRVAVALHFIHDKASVPARERPTRPWFGQVPDHAGRAAFVARQLLTYASYTEQLPALARLGDVARRVLAAG